MSGGIRQRALSASEATEPALTDAEIAHLANLGAQIEHHYGTPQNASWAIDRLGNAWILHARPVS